MKLLVNAAQMKAAVEARRKQEQAELDWERKMQEVMLTIKKMVPIRTMNYRRIEIGRASCRERV